MNSTSKKYECNHKTGRFVFTGLILILLISSAEGQTTVTQKPPIKDRIFYGGSIALQIGTATDIEILPVVGYWVLPRLAVALGPGLRFYNYQKQSTTIYSARSYVQFVPIRDIDKLIPIGVHTSIILQFEDEAMSLDSYYWHNVDRNPKRFWINSMLAGPGISQQMGRRSSINILFLWTLNDTGYSIYTNPVIRIGFVF
jgi:hypothetical protein